jgi:hypothetical protein
MADRTVEYLIAIDAKLKAIQDAQDEFERLRKKAEETNDKLKETSSIWESAFAIDVVHRAAEGVKQVVEVLADAVKEG